MNTIIIKSGQGNYDVNFYETVQQVIVHVGGLRTNQIYLIDRKVRDLHPGLFSHNAYYLEVDEEAKTLLMIEKFFTWLQLKGANKSSHLIAVGGGVVQDIATFVAHTYYRGIKWSFVPTTLLSQCDSCIGSKCGINLNGYKNQLGVFHAPSHVYICPEFLNTLDDTDIKSGYGEILKLMLIGGEVPFEQLKLSVDKFGLRKPLPPLIEDSLGVKKGIIEVDEYETGIRRILNYGHTFGHALESLVNIPHGLAVAWGIDVVNWIANQRGMLAGQTFYDVQNFIKIHLSSPTKVEFKNDDPSPLLQSIKRDKKAGADYIDLVLLQRPGHLVVVRTSFDKELEAQLKTYLELHNVYAGN